MAAVGVCCDYCVRVCKGRSRLRPNILICGTQASGKTTLAQRVCAKNDFTHIDLAARIRSERLYVDASGAIDEQRLVDYLQNEMRGGGFVCDYVDAQMLPDLLFDLVVLLRTDKSFLYPRLKRRGMQHRQIDAISGDKFQQSYAHAVREAFEPRLLMPLVSNELDDIERNAFTIAQDLDW